MNDPEDVLRSLRRYVAQMLGSPPWTVRLQRTRVADDERPVAIVEESGPLTTPFARARTVNQGDQQKQQSFTVVCYPPLGSQPVDSAETARQVASLLDAGFSRGLVTDDTPPVNIGAPFYFPVYDYAGVPITGSGRAGPQDFYTFAEVDNTFNVRAIQDAVDEKRYTVVANLRVRWWQAGRIPADAPIAESVTGTFETVEPDA